MGFKEDPNDPEDSEQPAISLLSHQPWNWRVSLSSIRGRLSLCLELSDFIEYTFIYFFFEVSCYPVLKVVWEICDRLCLGRAIGKHVLSWLRCLGILRQKWISLSLKLFFFCLFQKQLLPGDIPIMDQNLVLLWNMGKLLDNLQL